MSSPVHVQTRISYYRQGCLAAGSNNLSPVYNMQRLWELTSFVSVTGKVFMEQVLLCLVLFNSSYMMQSKSQVEQQQPCINVMLNNAMITETTRNNLGQPVIESSVFNMKSIQSPNSSFVLAVLYPHCTHLFLSHIKRLCGHILDDIAEQTLLMVTHR